ncbi:MAG: dihydropteroate synthase, partial [Planctomycetota bacterium]|nr:dihydropteroate synthase [Planctomycetota bacterium]
TTWHLAHHATLDLSRPVVVGILNITPDSFADGGRYLDPAAACAAASRMAEAGAHAIDLGGESTRPGSQRVSPEEQLARILPVIKAIRNTPGVLSTLPLSVDTTHASVARPALDAGANAINDVSGGTEDPAILDLAASTGAGLILMHRLREPGQDQYSDRYAAAPSYGNVVDAVTSCFERQLLPAAHARGVQPSQIVIDPGLGFGKSVDDNLQLIRGTPTLTTRLRLPLMSALSRKSFVGRISLGRDSTPAERLAGTLALSLEHLRYGATLFRVHDVAEHVQALAAAWAMQTLPS